MADSRPAPARTPHRTTRRVGLQQPNPDPQRCTHGAGATGQEPPDLDNIGRRRQPGHTGVIGGFFLEKAKGWFLGGGGGGFLPARVLGGRGENTAFLPKKGG